MLGEGQNSHAFVQLLSSNTEIMESFFQENKHLLANYFDKDKPGYFRSFRSLPIIRSILPKPDEKKMLIESLFVKQKQARSYKEWFEISYKLDELLNNNSWKCNPESALYDYDLIQNNLLEMRNARLSKDYKLLLYLIRTKWIRNIGNMGNINLYRLSHVGTKRLIEEYVQECEESLNYLISDEKIELDDKYLLGMLIQTRKNIGRTALVLSGGSTFGIFHIGVLVTLYEANLLPRIISGSSAGSIIAGILCCFSHENTLSILNGITEKSFNIFSNEEDDELKDKGNETSRFSRLLKSLSHLIKYGTLYDNSGLKETMRQFVGDITFREAYNRTGKILNITVSPASIHEQTKLLNYLTAPNCLIWSAVCASCSLPGLFPSASIYEKNPKTNEIHEWNNDRSMKYFDGSVDNDLPITRLLEMFNVDHIIAVQVNPHVVPILKVSVSNVGGDIENKISIRFKSFLNNVYDFVACEFIHYLQVLNEMDIYKNLSNKLISILSQNYSGDITILPDFKISDFVSIFDNPTPEFLLDFIFRGARAAWPKLTVIHNHCGVEFALDKAISTLRGKVITSSRKLLIARPNLSGTSNKSQYYTLNSPVTNSDRKLPIIPTIDQLRNKNVPRKRPNSVSNPGSISRIRRRGSLVGMTDKPKFDRGKSTTALEKMMYANESPVSSGSTFIDDESPIEPLKSPTNERRRNINDIRKRKEMRKAKSSGNFHQSIQPPAMHNDFKFPIDRIPCYKGNPYFQDYDYFEFSTPTTTIDKFKDRPNLPKVSATNSIRNSYIGLNRLKDDIGSQKNSNANLKELKDVHFKTISFSDSKLPDNNKNSFRDYLDFSDNEQDYLVFHPNKKSIFENCNDIGFTDDENTEFYTDEYSKDES